MSLPVCSSLLLLQQEEELRQKQEEEEGKQHHAGLSSVPLPKPPPLPAGPKPGLAPPPMAPPLPAGPGPAAGGSNPAGVCIERQLWSVVVHLPCCVCLKLGTHGAAADTPFFPCPCGISSCFRCHRCCRAADTAAAARAAPARPPASASREQQPAGVAATPGATARCCHAAAAPRTPSWVWDAAARHAAAATR